MEDNRLEENEARDLNIFEDWSRHHIRMAVIGLSRELIYFCDVCKASAGQKCAKDCEYQELKKLFND